MRARRVRGCPVLAAIEAEHRRLQPCVHPTSTGCAGCRSLAEASPTSRPYQATPAFTAGLCAAYSQVMRPPQQKPVMPSRRVAAVRAAQAHAGVEVAHHLGVGHLARPLRASAWRSRRSARRRPGARTARAQWPGSPSWRSGVPRRRCIRARRRSPDTTSTTGSPVLPSGLTKAEREMIVVATSNANGCQYCVIAHGAILRIRCQEPVWSPTRSPINHRKADITPRQTRL
jgi:AhpD family alkylhydroperoxidase